MVSFVNEAKTEELKGLLKTTFQTDVLYQVNNTECVVSDGSYLVTAESFFFSPIATPASFYRR